jgi:hypothetical protein
MVAHVLRGGLTLGAMGAAQECSMGEQLASDEVGIGEAVCAALGEDVPDGDEEFAGNGNSGLVATKTGLEARELRFPVGMATGGSVSGFDHCGADVTPASLGHTAGAASEAAVVDARAEASVAHELLGGREARDVADGGQEGHGGDEANAGQLDEEWHALILGSDGLDGVLKSLDLGAGKGEGIEVNLDTCELGGADVESKPPGAHGRGERGAVGGRDVVAVEDGVEAVLGLGSEADHLGAVGDEGAAIADVAGRHPNRREEGASVEAGQDQGGLLVGDDLGLSD